LNYTVAGLADFTGDGKTDILWRHVGTGYNYLWTMNGTAVAASATINRVSDLNMKVAGVGDFNADGKADILWRNASTGHNNIYLMNGKTVVSNTAITRLTDLNYKVAGVGDFTGDGKADILWRHHGTGYNYLWTMNGTTVVSSATINRVSDLNMKVVGFGVSPDYYNWNRLAESEQAEAALMAASAGDAEMQLVEPESLEGAPYEASDAPMVLDVPADAAPEVALPGTLPEDAYTDEPVIELEEPLPDEQEPTSVTLARFESQPTSGTWAIVAPFALLGLLGAGLLLRRRTR
ncbi:MAG TPA: VCBS repeat-containing protein, partial [Ardenticatenaceae bacterium]